jgi:hypothetical protein
VQHELKASRQRKQDAKIAARSLAEVTAQPTGSLAEADDAAYASSASNGAAGRQVDVCVSAWTASRAASNPRSLLAGRAR